MYIKAALTKEMYIFAMRNKGIKGAKSQTDIISIKLTTDELWPVQHESYTKQYKLSVLAYNYNCD